MNYDHKKRVAIRAEVFEAAQALQAARQALAEAQARYDLAIEADNQAWGEES